MATDDYQRAIDLPPVGGETLPCGRALSSGELGALFEACADDSSPAGARDAALLAVLYGVGLRRAEVVALDWSATTPESGELKIRGGKGHKARLCYTGENCREALVEWLQLRGDQEGPLFLPLSKERPPRGGQLLWRRLQDQAVMGILLKRAREARLKPCSPHDFRRSFICSTPGPTSQRCKGAAFTFCGIAPTTTAFSSL